MSLTIGSLTLTLSFLPVLVFLAEMCVVSLGTVRIIFVSRGRKYLASMLGCFEIVIWLFAISQIMQNISDIACFLAYAAGFVCGNFLGIRIEEKLAIGNLVVRIISKKNAGRLIADLRAANYGVTQISGEGATGPVQVIFTIIKRRQLAQVVNLIKQFDNKAFYSVEDIRSASEGIFADARVAPRTMIQVESAKMQTAS